MGLGEVACTGLLCLLKVTNAPERVAEITLL